MMESTQVLELTQTLDTTQLAESPDIAVKVGCLKINGVDYFIWNKENTIGRDESCDIVINNKAVSVEHAVIEADAFGKHLIWDLGSTNKTRLGEVQLKPRVRHYLNDGARLRFANVNAVYHHIKSNSPPKAPLPAPLPMQIPGTPERDEVNAAVASIVAETPGKDDYNDGSSDGDFFGERDSSSIFVRPLKISGALHDVHNVSHASGSMAENSVNGSVLGTPGRSHAEQPEINPACRIINDSTVGEANSSDATMDDVDTSDVIAGSQPMLASEKAVNIFEIDTVPMSRVSETPVKTLETDKLNWDDIDDSIDGISQEMDTIDSLIESKELHVEFTPTKRADTATLKEMVTGGFSVQEDLQQLIKPDACKNLDSRFEEPISRDKGVSSEASCALPLPGSEVNVYDVDTVPLQVDSAKRDDENIFNLVTQQVTKEIDCAEADTSVYDLATQQFFGTSSNDKIPVDNPVLDKNVGADLNCGDIPLSTANPSISDLPLQVGDVDGQLFPSKSTENPKSAKNSSCVETSLVQLHGESVTPCPELRDEKTHGSDVRGDQAFYTDAVRNAQILEITSESKGPDSSCVDFSDLPTQQGNKAAALAEGYESKGCDQSLSDVPKQVTFDFQKIEKTRNANENFTRQKEPDSSRLTSHDVSICEMLTQPVHVGLVGMDTQIGLSHDSGSSPQSKGKIHEPCATDVSLSDLQTQVAQSSPSRFQTSATDVSFSDLQTQIAESLPSRAQPETHAADVSFCDLQTQVAKVLPNKTQVKAGAADVSLSDLQTQVAPSLPCRIQAEMQAADISLSDLQTQVAQNLPNREQIESDTADMSLSDLQTQVAKHLPNKTQMKVGAADVSLSDLQTQVAPSLPCGVQAETQAADISFADLQTQVAQNLPNRIQIESDAADISLSDLQTQIAQRSPCRAQAETHAADVSISDLQTQVTLNLLRDEKECAVEPGSEDVYNAMTQMPVAEHQIMLEESNTEQIERDLDKYENAIIDTSVSDASISSTGKLSESVSPFKTPSKVQSSKILPADPRNEVYFLDTQPLNAPTRSPIAGSEELDEVGDSSKIDTVSLRATNESICDQATQEASRKPIVTANIYDIDTVPLEAERELNDGSTFDVDTEPPSAGAEASQALSEVEVNKSALEGDSVVAQVQQVTTGAVVDSDVSRKLEFCDPDENSVENRILAMNDKNVNSLIVQPVSGKTKSTVAELLQTLGDTPSLDGQDQDKPAESAHSQNSDERCSQFPVSKVQKTVKALVFTDSEDSYDSPLIVRRKKNKPLVDSDTEDCAMLRETEKTDVTLGLGLICNGNSEASKQDPKEILTAKESTLSEPAASAGIVSDHCNGKNVGAGETSVNDTTESFKLQVSDSSASCCLIEKTHQMSVIDEMSNTSLNSKKLVENTSSEADPLQKSEPKLVETITRTPARSKSGKSGGNPSQTPTSKRKDVHEVPSAPSDSLHNPVPLADTSLLIHSTPPKSDMEVESKPSPEFMTTHKSPGKCSPLLSPLKSPKRKGSEVVASREIATPVKRKGHTERPLVETPEIPRDFFGPSSGGSGIPVHERPALRQYVNRKKLSLNSSSLSCGPNASSTPLSEKDSHSVVDMEETLLTSVRETKGKTDKKTASSKNVEPSNENSQMDTPINVKKFKKVTPVKKPQDSELFSQDGELQSSQDEFLCSQEFGRGKRKRVKKSFFGFDDDDDFIPAGICSRKPHSPTSKTEVSSSSKVTDNVSPVHDGALEVNTPRRERPRKQAFMSCESDEVKSPENSYKSDTSVVKSLSKVESPSNVPGPTVLVGQASIKPGSPSGISSGLDLKRIRNSLRATLNQEGPQSGVSKSECSEAPKTLKTINADAPMSPGRSSSQADNKSPKTDSSGGAKRSSAVLKHSIHQGDIDGEILTPGHHGSGSASQDGKSATPKPSKKCSADAPDVIASTSCTERIVVKVDTRLSPARRVRGCPKQDVNKTEISPSILRDRAHSQDDALKSLGGSCALKQNSASTSRGQLASGQVDKAVGQPKASKSRSVETMDPKLVVSKSPRNIPVENTANASYKRIEQLPEGVDKNLLRDDSQKPQNRRRRMKHGMDSQEGVQELSQESQGSVSSKNSVRSRRAHNTRTPMSSQEVPKTEKENGRSLRKRKLSGGSENSEKLDTFGVEEGLKDPIKNDETLRIGHSTTDTKDESSLPKHEPKDSVTVDKPIRRGRGRPPKTAGAVATIVSPSASSKDVANSSSSQPKQRGRRRIPGKLDDELQGDSQTDIPSPSLSRRNQKRDLDGNPIEASETVDRSLGERKKRKLSVEEQPLEKVVGISGAQESCVPQGSISKRLAPKRGAKQIVNEDIPEISLSKSNSSGSVSIATRGCRNAVKTLQKAEEPVAEASGPTDVSAVDVASPPKVRGRHKKAVEDGLVKNEELSQDLSQGRRSSRARKKKESFDEIMFRKEEEIRLKKLQRSSEQSPSPDKSRRMSVVTPSASIPSVSDVSAFSIPSSPAGSSTSKRSASRLGTSSSTESLPTSTKQSRSNQNLPPTPQTGQMKVMFTALADTKLSAMVKKLGGKVVEKPKDCSVLVTDKVKRTVKFLCALGLGKPIVSPNWISKSKAFSQFVDPNDSLLKDKEGEEKFDFELGSSLEKARSQRLLEGYSVYTTSSILPPPKEMKPIIECSGGTFLAKPPAKWAPGAVVISDPKDRTEWPKLTKNGVTPPILSAEAVLTGILQQRFDLEKHRLK